jgi:nitroimidazol reductase NimA-like FMN-containing flavoprotein (pyridoxamine 5'-phosphate oxidase superfamily)
MSVRDDSAVSPGPGIEVFAEAECRRRLSEGGVGRIAMRAMRGSDDDGAPEMRPVNFLLHGDDVIIRTGDGAILEAARRGGSAGFEIDDIDRLEHTGWSVVVTGKLFELPTDDEHLALPLRPWAAGRKDRFVGLAIERITGLRIPPGRGNR